MTDRNKMVRMESLRTHTLYGAGHERPHGPGDLYEVEEQYVDTLEGQGMAKRSALSPDSLAKPAAATKAPASEKPDVKKPKK